MTKEYELTSPFIDLEWEGNTEHFGLIVAVWMAFWAVVVVGLIYAYAVMLPEWIGFETTVLVGIALLITSSQ